MVAQIMNKEHSVPEVYVVFDTSVLYPKWVGPLFSEGTTALLERHRKRKGISINWYLPNVVRNERQYQMQDKARGLLAHIQTLEEVSRREFGITESSVMEDVERAIKEQINELGLTVIDLDVAKVEWETLIFDACNRRPPFEKGERGKEKGFRDALIAETFYQLVKASPSDEDKCRIFFLCQDKLLIEAVRLRIADRINVKVFSSLIELEEAIDIIAAEETDEFITKYELKAQECFESSLFDAPAIFQRIEGKLGQHLSAVPSGADERQNLRISVLQTRFRERKNGRSNWATRIMIQSEAYARIHTVPDYVSFGTRLSYPDVSGTTTILPEWLNWPSSMSNAAPPAFMKWIQPAELTATPWHTDIYSWLKPSEATQIGPIPDNRDWIQSGGIVPTGPSGAYQRSTVNKGHSLFDVIWSVEIAKNGELENPKIEDIEYVETTWML